MRTHATAFRLGPASFLALALASVPFGTLALAAETSLSDARKPGSAYKKTMPGSTKKIAGSKSRSYIQPKKQTYQEHMASLSTHRFKSEASSSASTSSSFGRKTAAQVSAKRGSSSGGGSSRPSSIHQSSSRVNVQKNVGRPSSGLSRNRPLSAGDFAFLNKIAQTIRPGNPAAASGLDRIIAGQKQGRTLTKDEYEALTALAGQVEDGRASYQLNSIAAKRRDTGL